MLVCKHVSVYFHTDGLILIQKSGDFPEKKKKKKELNIISL